MTAPKKPATIGEVIEETKKAFAKPLTRELPPKRRGSPPPSLPSPGVGATVLPLHARSTGGDRKPSEMRPLGPREFLVPGLGIQSRGRPCVILGLPGSRKGFFSMALQVVMAAGGDFIGERFPGGGSPDGRIR